MSKIINRLFKKQNREDNELKALGIKIYADQQLQERLALGHKLQLVLEGGDLGAFIDDKDGKNELDRESLVELNILRNSTNYQDRIEIQRLRLSYLALVLRTTAVPWMRAGDHPGTRTILKGWEGLYALAKETIDSTKNLIRRSDTGGIAQKYVNKDELIANLEGFLNVEVIRFGLIILDSSYKSEDVRPSQVTVINQQGGGGYGPIRRQDPIFTNNQDPRLEDQRNNQQ